MVQNEYLISTRNKILGLFYRGLLKRFYFRLDPEFVHDRMVRVGEFLGSSGLGKKLADLLFGYQNKVLEQNILGIKFPNPLGLAAGFDKEGKLTDILPSVGFGFMEIGSVTGEPCEGNPKPRLWRLKKSKGLVVYYGLKNEGCEKISARLKKKSFQIPLGVSVAKTNCPETCQTEVGVADYFKAYASFTDIGSFYTINISCPNTFGGEPFTDPKKLELLLQKIAQAPSKKPIFLKLSPDLKKEVVDKIIKISGRYRVSGFVCSNLTKDRKNKKLKICDQNVPEKGGISGKVMEELANDLTSYIYQKTKGRFVIVGCGGVFSAADAYKKIKLGASLVQLITGMIFEGPQVISEINQGLVKLLRKDGYTNISQAVGKG